MIYRRHLIIINNNIDSYIAHFYPQCALFIASWGGINSDTPPQLEEERVFPPVQNN